MSFTIFYNLNDLKILIDGLSRVDLPESDKILALKYLDAGLKNWDTAPLGQSPFEEPIPTNTARVVTVGGENTSLVEFRTLLYRIAKQFPDTSYLKSLADDMTGNCGAIES